jgi:hypothetical protein
MKGLFILLGVGVVFFLVTLGAPEALAAVGIYGDKTKRFASAIAFAEGYWDANNNILPDNVPARSHNPGDLSPGDTPGFTATYTDGSYVSQLPDDNTGWNFLYAKVDRILGGKSVDNNGKGVDATILDVAQKYAGDWVSWAHNVSSYLGVQQTTTLREWLNT